MTAHGILLCHFALREVGGDTEEEESEDVVEPAAVYIDDVEQEESKGSPTVSGSGGRSRSRGSPAAGDAGLLDASLAAVAADAILRDGAYVDPQPGSDGDPGSARV